jgi:hypothetical protein
MHDHTRAILAQMSDEDRKFYEREPARSWLAQMATRLSVMTVTDGAKMLREHISTLAKPTKVASKPAAPAQDDREALVLSAPVSPLTRR